MDSSCSRYGSKVQMRRMHVIRQGASLPDTKLCHYVHAERNYLMPATVQLRNSFF